jgi:sugar/nucleoside kinase (ribokinase family)
MAAVGRIGGKAAMITKVGDDEWGKLAISDFKKYNVDTSHVFVDKSVKTWLTFILLGKNGTNQWVEAEHLKDFDLPTDIHRAVNWVIANPLNSEEMQRHETYSNEQLDILTEGKILNLGECSEITLKAARIAKRKDIPTCYDMETYSHPYLLEFLKNITYCILSRKTAMEFTKETDLIAMCKKLRSYGPEVVGLTLGENGSVFATGNEVIVRKAFKVQAIDTTGAGDVFHGAFSFGIVQGWDLSRVIEFSSAVSAIKCTKVGGRAGIPTLPEVEAFLKKHVDEIR